MIERVTYNVRAQLLEDMLGTVPMNRAVYTQHIQSKALEEIRREARRGVPLADGLEATPARVEERLAQEQETVTDVPGDEARGWTTFHRDAEGPFLYDYVLRGFLHEAARTLGTWGLLKQLHSKFRKGVFVFPRKIRLVEVSGTNERPLRAETAKGPRVTVVRSDTIAAGTLLAFQLLVLAVTGITQNCLEDVLSYGELQGLGQWRGGGWGRFKVEGLEEAAGPATTTRRRGSAAQGGSK